MSNTQQDFYQKFMGLSHNKYVKASTLIFEYKVPYKTILNGINNTRNGKSISWIAIKTKRNDFLILFDSIPLKTRNRYQVRTAEEVRSKDLYVDQIKDIQYQNKEKQEIYNYLKMVVENPAIWRKYLIEITDSLNDFGDSFNLSKRYALWEAILKLNSQGYKLRLIYNVIQEKVFTILGVKNYAYFTTKIKKAKEEGVKKILIHGSLGRKFTQRTKMTIWHKRFVERLYCDKRKLTIKQIYRDLNGECIIRGKSQISYDSVSKYLRSPEIKNRYGPTRNGEKWAQLNFFPYLLRGKPEYCDDLWEADGKTLQFWVKENKKFYRPVMFLIIDTKSKYIVGYSVGTSENSQLVIDCLQRALESHYRLPHEFVCDNGTALNSKAVHNFRAEANNLSYMEFRQHQPRNPQDKGTIERLLYTLQIKYFRNYKGYLGDGIKSRREGSDISSEERDKSYKNAMQFGKIEKMVDEVIEKHNTTVEEKNTKTPSEVYRNDKCVNSTKINIEQILKLTNEPLGERKITRGMLSYRIKGEDFVYTIKNPKLFNKYNGTIVKVWKPYFGHDKIHIFSLNEKFLFTLKRTIPIRTTGINKNISLEEVRKFATMRKDFSKFSRDKVKKLFNFDE